MSPIDVGGLLEELESDRRDRGGISTISLNVVAFVENDEALLHWLAESSDEFAEAHGFRIIVLDASSQPVTHSVRTHYKECNDTLMTSLEQVQLGVKGISANELRSVVHDLLHPNVRNVLLWGGEHLSDERFSALADFSQRVIIASSRRTSGLQALREVVQLADTHVVERVRDTSYMRLLPWQDLIAQFFDEPDLAEELPNLSRISVASGSEAEAYYLAAWLAGRLGWNPCGHLQFCDASGRPVRVDFRKKGDPRRIRGIELQAAQCTFGISVSPDADDLICLTVNGRKQRPVHCVPLHDVDIVSLVERAIFSPDDGGVYLETLGVLRKLLEFSA
ncbi:MAG TPA: glucose-6-phosphate dehydrogenase assembly protein OpcA [Candidatus Baltobacteraceae bacterium]|nr:glucose-6-phosphate dehydrogenase assembly protein OpcA [Candidatus Baltobacteraceae bacterium]